MSVLAIVQARFSSTRFHGKVLADLGGRPVIAHVLERALQIRGVDRVVLALPDGEAEAPLHDWAGHYCPCDFVIVQGVETHDVLGRFAAVVRLYPEAEIVMRLTADCPLLQPDVCARVLDLYRSYDAYSYVWTNTHTGEWPDGLDCEVFDAWLLLAADEAHDVTLTHREHVTGWIRDHAFGAELAPDPAYAAWPKVSIDTEEDLERVRALLRAPGPYVGQAPILQ